MADKVFLKECYILGTNQYHALDDGVWENLKVPTTLSLTNKDKESNSSKEIFLKFNDKFIGKLSDEDAKDIVKYLQAGWEDKLYEVKLSYKDDKKADENKRMKVVIFIKPQN